LTWNGYLSFSLFFLINKIFLIKCKTYQKIPSFPLVPFDSTLIAPFCKISKIKIPQTRSCPTLQETQLQFLVATVWMNLQLCYTCQHLLPGSIHMSQTYNVSSLYFFMLIAYLKDWIQKKRQNWVGIFRKKNNLMSTDYPPCFKTPT
jgi:hypothetical protein